MSVVYFDRNVFADICDLRRGLSQADVSKIQRAVSAGIINIPTSYTVLEETISLVRSSEEQYMQHIQTVLNLIDKNRIIKPHTQLLQEDCESYAFRKPYTPRTTKLLYDGFRKLLDLSLNQQGLITLANEIHAFYTDSATKAQAWLDNVLEKSPPRAKNFQEVWDELSLRAVEDILGKLSRPVRRRCEKRGTPAMLNIKSLRLYAIYRCWITYSYCLKSDGTPGKIQPSDGGDFLHAVHASAADIFVTQERKDKQGKLPFILSQVSTPGLRVMNLPEFLATL